MLSKCAFAALAFAGLALGGPLPPHTDHGMMTMNGLLGVRQDKGFDAQDLSHIKKLTALGDSYSAGIGAGDRLGTVLGAALSQTGTFFSSQTPHEVPAVLTILVQTGLAVVIPWPIRASSTKIRG